MFSTTGCCIVFHNSSLVFLCDKRILRTFLMQELVKTLICIGDSRSPCPVPFPLRTIGFTMVDSEHMQIALDP
ncbi:hypothetical protein DPMN_128603 [Dreissena polymorpha]|uniref:Uncharacterized protein n=1 Tax=Dreissena polymorpha TaxID=45954 RepID=A0A9D4H3F4_DREPO|nr:hypothetical protein DPMN_128603 [Dreissena polymorpha]